VIRFFLRHKEIDLLAGESVLFFLKTLALPISYLPKKSLTPLIRRETTLRP